MIVRWVLNELLGIRVPILMQELIRPIPTVEDVVKVSYTDYATNAARGWVRRLEETLGRPLSPEERRTYEMVYRVIYAGGLLGATDDVKQKALERLLASERTAERGRRK